MFKKFVIGLSLVLSSITFAQDKWVPTNTVTMLNPFPAGGVTDQQLRYIATKLSERWKQPVIVQNRLGAAGTLAAASLTTAKPDGHTLAILTVNSWRYPHYSELSWHPIRDFKYVVGMNAYTLGIIVRADSPWKSLDDLIAAGKAEPNKYNYATVGVGGGGQLMMIEIDNTTNAKFTNVPYKGGTEFNQALLGGEVQFVADASNWAPFVDSGQFRALAMATEKRVAKYPNVPTLTEKGIKVIGQSPYGLVAPKGTPDHVAQAIHDAVTDILKEPEMQELMKKFVLVPWTKTPQEFEAYAAQYFRDVRPLLIKAGLVKDAK